MNRNNFWTAALESNDGTVGPDAVTEQSTMQPKPGVGKGDAVESEEKPKKEFGEDHVLTDNDDIDVVAESQETTIALEMLSDVTERFLRYASAIEEMTDQIEQRLEVNDPLSAGETSLLTTAIDASGVGTPLSENVALESYDFSARVATEGFVDTLKERSGKVQEALGKFAKRMGGEVQSRLSVFSAAFKKYPDNRIAPLKKKIAAVEGVTGRNFENSKREASIQKKIYAPSSSKNPLAALRDSLAAYDAAASFIDGPMVSAVAQMKRAYSTADFDKMPAALNKMLGTVSELTTKHSTNSKFTTTHVTVAIKTITPENATSVGIKGITRTPAKPDYDNSLKIASAADLNELASLATKATRVFDTKIREIFEEIATSANQKNQNTAFFNDSSVGNRRADKTTGAWTQLKFAAGYRGTMHLTLRAISTVEISLAEAVLRNAVAAADWIAASIAEANAMQKTA